jgi:hypothetical protein
MGHDWLRTLDERRRQALSEAKRLRGEIAEGMRGEYVMLLPTGLHLLYSCSDLSGAAHCFAGVARLWQ